MVRTILLAAALSTLPSQADYTIPVMSAHGDASYRTTLFIENVTENDVICRFSLPDEEATRTAERLTTTIFPQFLRHLTVPVTVRAACPGDVDIFVRIQTSYDRGRTWDRGRIFEAMTVAATPRHRIQITSDLVVGESTGHPADVRLTIRRGDIVTRDETVRFEGGSLTLMTFGDGEPLAPDLTVEFEVISGKGRLAVGEAIRDARIRNELEHRERMAFRNKSVSPDNMRAARMLGISPFKAAPFQDPATGLIYMRERWYDPRTGTFLTPDPMGFLDSSNTYAYGAGDPVNNSDPTGLALYAFDGTANTPEDRTNVFKLSSVYNDGAGAFYREGVGTNWYSIGWGRFTGLGGKRRVNQMYDVFRKIYQVDPSIDIIGFSRGAAQALDFANKIYREGVYDERLRMRVTPSIRFLGVFDTVASFGVPGDDDNWNYHLSVPPNVQRARHATAENEYRSGFPLNRLWNEYGCGANPKIVEKSFPGSHSDVGGGYRNDYQSRVPLQWMWKEMTAAGINMNALPPVLGSIPAGATPIAHESHRSLAYLNDWRRVTKNRSWGITPGRQVYLPDCP